MRHHLTALVLGLGTVASVSAAQDPQRLPPVVTTDSSNGVLTVQNRRKAPVTIYMEYGRFDRRLGVVPAMQTARLPLPEWAVRGRARIQLFAHPAGEAADLASREFSLTPPARLAMVIPPSGMLPPQPADTMMAVIPPEALADATLTVDNPRATAVTVFAEPGPFEVRLGRVPPRSRVTLRFPTSVILPGKSIRLFVQPDGGMDMASELRHIRPGEHLGLRVPQH